MNPKSATLGAKKIAVAVSGSGRSLQNFLVNAPSYPEYVVAGVIASRQDCRAVEIANERKLPVFIGNFSPGAASCQKSLDEWLRDKSIDWVALAGFLKKFPDLPEWRQRVINIHPALLPKFGGKGMYGDRVHAAVLAAGESISGATIHFVTENYDEGAIIAQVTVPVLAYDRPETLAARVFAAECELYPEVLKRLILGSLPLSSGHVERVKYEQL